MKALLKTATLSCLILLSAYSGKAAPAIVTSADFNQLKGAIESNSEVHLDFDGTVEFPQAINISKKVLLIATDRSVVFRGAGSRLFNLSDGADLAIIRVTLSGGASPNTETGSSGYGGAVWMTNSVLTLNNCIVSNNVARGIPGRCDFDGAQYARINSGSGFGGGIAAWASKVLVADTVFENNSALGEDAADCVTHPVDSEGGAAQGGAIYANLTEITAWRCVFRSNRARGMQFQPNIVKNQGDGGAVFATGNRPVQIVDSAFVGNTANRGTGGALTLHSEAWVLRSNFSLNTSQSFPGTAGLGGAIYHSARLHLIQSAFSSNTVTAGDSTFTALPAYGGAVASSGVLFSTNCAFYENLAIERGNDPGGGNVIGLVSPGRAYLTRNSFSALRQRSGMIRAEIPCKVFLEACAGYGSLSGEVVSLGFNAPFAIFDYLPEHRLSFLRPIEGSVVMGLAKTPWTAEDIRGARRPEDISDAGSFDTNGRFFMKIFKGDPFVTGLLNSGEGVRYFSSSDMVTWNSMPSPRLENLPPPPLVVPNDGGVRFFKAQIE